MTPDAYIALRDELRVQLEKVLTFGNLPVDLTRNLESVKRRLTNSAFSIALIGTPESGTSTTFNAICDGREISPRGCGIRRSACKLSAKSLSDAEAEEYALLEWKREEELLLTVISLIAPRLRQKVPDRFSSMCECEMIHDLRLSNRDDVILIRSCLDEEWSKYKEDPCDYDSEDTDRVSRLFMSRLIVEFCGAQEYLNVIDSDATSPHGNVADHFCTKIRIHDLEQYAVFPLKWAECWAKGDANSFSANEAAFALLKGITCYLHSATLARLGCEITECPALFNSDSSTKITEDAMRSADLILYIATGHRIMSNYDLQVLKAIKRAGQEHKLLIAVNTQIQRERFLSTIATADVAFLREAGFGGFDMDSLFVYNSLLGLCAKNGRAIKNDTFEQVSAERFVRVARACDDSYPDDVTSLWPMVVEDSLCCYLSRDEFAENKDSYIADVTALGELSGLNKIFDAIEDRIVQKKAGGLLVSGGSKRIDAAMEALECELDTEERMAPKTADAISAKSEVLETVSSKLKTILDPQLARPVTHDLFDRVILASIDDIADDLAERCANNLVILWDIFKSLLSKDAKKCALKSWLKPLVKDTVAKILSPALKGWISNVKSGDNIVWQTTLGVQRKNIVDSMHQICEAAGLGESSCLYGCPEDIAFRSDRGYASQDAMNHAAESIVANVTDFLLARAFPSVLNNMPTILVALSRMLVQVPIVDPISGIKNKLKLRFRAELAASFASSDAKEKLLDDCRKLILGMQKHLCDELEYTANSICANYSRRTRVGTTMSANSSIDRHNISGRTVRLKNEFIKPIRAWCRSFEKKVEAKLTNEAKSI